MDVTHSSNCICLFILINGTKHMCICIQCLNLCSYYYFGCTKSNIKHGIMMCQNILICMNCEGNVLNTIPWQIYHVYNMGDTRSIKVWDG